MIHRTPALLVMHSDLAAALLRAAEKVYGPVESVEVLSNEGLSREEMEQAIAKRFEGWRDGGLVLTDFWGGSCHICGVAAAAPRPHLGGGRRGGRRRLGARPARGRGPRRRGARGDRRRDGGRVGGGERRPRRRVPHRARPGGGPDAGRGRRGGPPVQSR